MHKVPFQYKEMNYLIPFQSKETPFKTAERNGKDKNFTLKKMGLFLKFLLVNKDYLFKICTFRSYYYFYLRQRTYYDKMV